jgi:hypothetical protein
MATSPTFTINSRPNGYDQTQRRFTLSGLLGLVGLYVNGTGIPIDFTAIFNASGNKVTIPPTYTGGAGPGQAVPVAADIESQGGYSLFYDSTNKSIRIFAGTTEASSAAVPTPLLAATIAIAVAGTGYATNDTFSIAGMPGAVGTVTAQAGGVPSAIVITTQGALVAGTAVATTAITGTGSGLTVTITVAAGIPATFSFLRG